MKQHRARYNEQEKKEKAKVSRTKLTRRRERPNTAKARQRCAIAAADSELVNMALMTAIHDSKTAASDDSSAVGHSPRCHPKGR